MKFSYSKSSFFRFVKTYPARYWRWYLGGVLALLVTNYIMALIPRKIEQAIDFISFGSQASDEVWSLVLIVIGLAVVLVAFRTISRVLIFFPGRFVECDVRNDIYRQLMKLSASFYLKHKPGDLMSRSANDIKHLRLMVGFALLSLANTFITYAFVLYQMQAISLKLTFYSLLPVPVIIIFIFKIAGKFHRAVVRTQKSLGSLTDSAVETFSNISVVKSFRTEDSFARQFHKQNQEYCDAALNVAKYRSLMFPFLAVIGSIGNMVLFYAGGPMIIRKELSLGEFTAFSAYISLLAWPTASLAYMFSVFQRGIVALNRVYEILDEVPEIKNTKTTKTALTVTKAPHIMVKNLSFSFAGVEAAVLKNITFEIGPGQSLGVFGPTGAGKSVLTRLLARIYKAPSNTIFIDGESLEDYPVEEFRKALTYTPQNSFLFSTSILENIIYSQDYTSGAEDERKVQEVVKCAVVDGDILNFPRQFSTLVGERGIVLSGGQKKRIALARALFKNFHIAIFDEILSAVDHDTEQLMVCNLREVLQNKTSIIVSHRISALSACDHIIILDNGRIIDSGKHEDLLLKPGIYRDTWIYQGTMANRESLGVVG